MPRALVARQEYNPESRSILPSTVKILSLASGACTLNPEITCSVVWMRLESSIWRLRGQSSLSHVISGKGRPSAVHDRENVLPTNPLYSVVSFNTTGSAVRTKKKQAHIRSLVIFSPPLSVLPVTLIRKECDVMLPPSTPLEALHDTWLVVRAPE